VNIAVSVPWGASTGQPEQAAWPTSMAGPPLTVGTGVAFAPDGGAE
jgi:hypothetical protein